MEGPSEQELHERLEGLAPGTPLREGLDSIISARIGALIVIGDERKVAPLCNGGFDLSVPFTPQRLFELAKMDGAIVVDTGCSHILKANVHLVPDASLPSSETGTRHRTAERVSRQTSALVVSISQRRDVVSLYLKGQRIVLEDIDVLLSKANQALRTLESYRARLDQVLERLTALELSDAVTVTDVAEAINRFEMSGRVAREINRYITQLGTDGRLVRMQAAELVVNVNETYLLLLRDYAADPSIRRVSGIKARIAELTSEELRDVARVAEALGLPSDKRGAEDHLDARPYRLLKRVPMLPSSVVNRLVERFDTVPSLVHASIQALDEVDGVGSRRARAIHEALIRSYL